MALRDIERSGTSERLVEASENANESEAANTQLVEASKTPDKNEAATKSSGDESDPLNDNKNEKEKANETSHQGVMTVVEHLDELRTRLIRSLCYVFGSFVVMLFFTKTFLQWLEKPAGSITFQVLSLEEPLVVYFKVAFYASLILASPFVLYEISAFVAPGLTRRERQVMAPIVVGSPILFVCGAMFAYFCLLPPMLGFFGMFGQGIAPIHQRLDFYISLVSSIMLYLGLAFQMPIILFALSFTGLVTSRLLLSIWRYAVVVVTIIAAIITPDPTAMSMLIVMFALITLYFFSIGLLKLFGK